MTSDVDRVLVTTTERRVHTHGHCTTLICARALEDMIVFADCACGRIRYLYMDPLFLEYMRRKMGE